MTDLQRHNGHRFITINKAAKDICNLFNKAMQSLNRIGEFQMTDITKCGKTNCPSSHVCYRFTAPAKQFKQSWFYPEPVLDGDKCEFFYALDAVEAVSGADYYGDK